MKIGVRVVELDVARAIAIALALGWHFYTPTGITFVDWLQEPGRLIGWAGVDLFFVLSGFLIGGLIFGEVMKSGSFNAKRFLIRRAFKIWPVLYLYIAILVVTGRYHPMEVVPQTLLHLQNYWTTPLNHLWSLAVEEHFYLIFALIAANTSLARGDVRRVPVALICVVVAATIFRFIGVLAEISQTSLQIQTQFRVDALALGVLLAYLKMFNSDLFNRLASRKVLMIIFVSVGVAALIVIRDSKPLIATIGYSITMLTSGCLLLLMHDASVFRNPNPAVKTVAWIGGYSYALYVFQFVMYRALEKGWVTLLKTEIPPLALLAMKYGGALLIAVVVTRLVERPMLHLRNRLFPA